MDLRLSEAERIFILHGVESNTRNDGRCNDDFRPIVIETDVVRNASGSARVRIGSTDVLVGVKAEIDTPSSSKPDYGRIEVFVDCSANASPEFEGRGGDSFAREIADALLAAYSNKVVADRLLKKLCLLSGRLCWLLYIDVVVLECRGGNAFDCASLAVKCALHDLKLPKATVSYNENGVADVELGDAEENDDDVWRLDAVACAPVLVTVGKLGAARLLVDATAEEEACLKSALIVGVLGSENSQARITLVKQSSGNGGSLDPDSINEMIQAAVEIGCKLNVKLTKKLEQEENEDRPALRGFLL